MNNSLMMSKFLRIHIYAGMTSHGTPSASSSIEMLVVKIAPADGADSKGRERWNYDWKEKTIAVFRI